MLNIPMNRKHCSSAVTSPKLLLYPVVLIISVLLLSGCAAVAIGVGVGTGVAYAKGALTASVDAAPDDIARASEQALRDLTMRDIEVKATRVDARIEAYTAENKKITIQAKRQTENISDLSIRVGTFGDQKTSQLIYDKIKKHLP